MSPPLRWFAVFALLAGCGGRSPRPTPNLTTIAETSGYVRTGRYDEVIRLCDDFARAYDGVRCERIGTTVEERELVAVVVSRSHAAPVPTVMIQAGIHAGEIDGKDAGFWLLRDLLDGKILPGALDAVGLVFVPVLNPDGHERFGPNNRPNQRGPEEMGFRTNAANLNLNRDYMKADAPETRAILKLIAGYDPVMFIDLHTTDGAKFEHDISVNIAPLAPRPDQLDETAAAISAGVQRRLTALGHLPLDFYPAFVVDDDPASGFTLGEPPARFSHAYISARSRLGVLIETHSWRTYKERVESTYRALEALIEQATTDAARWRATETAADAADLELARAAEVPILFDNNAHTREIEFRGYAYERRSSDVSGGTWVIYDEAAPQIWKVPLFDELVPVIQVKPPRAGYVVDGGFARDVIPVLDAHGLQYDVIDNQPKVTLDVFRATKVTHHPTTEGRTRVALEGAWTPETRTLDRHAIFVPIQQRNLRVILALFDPVSPDSFAQWGFFNAVFERKEYLEPYLAEAAARELLEDPAVKQAWDAALADPALAKDAGKRLEWFHRRHPSWDERKDLLPVYRVDRAIGK